jgi:hypothetical protein
VLGNGAFPRRLRLFDHLDPEEDSASGVEIPEGEYG